MIILGIDPGSRHTGYGVVEVDDGAARALEHGVLHLNARDSHQLRLKHIYDRLTQITERTLPDECAIEMPVYGQNPQSMLKLGRAQAAAMLAVLSRGLPVTEYTPAEVKQAVTGNGNATKEQVRYMVRTLLDLGQDVLGLDASDALAVGLCHQHRRTQQTTTSHKNWASFVQANPGRIAR